MESMPSRRPTKLSKPAQLPPRRGSRQALPQEATGQTVLDIATSETSSTVEDGSRATRELPCSNYNINDITSLPKSVVAVTIALKHLHD